MYVRIYEPEKHCVLLILYGMKRFLLSLVMNRSLVQMGFRLCYTRVALAEEEEEESRGERGKRRRRREAEEEEEGG